MSERPILFSGPMIRAILEGRKTQTRRVVKKQPKEGERLTAQFFARVNCPFGHPGDRLWVRETWAMMCRVADPDCYCEDEAQHYFEYRADTGNKRPGDWPDPEDEEFQDAPRWRPSIHMPRRACRIFLEISEVRVERLLEICEEDAKKEGYPTVPSPSTLTESGMKWMKPKDWFHEQWARIYGYHCESNPWVWVIEFKPLETLP